MKARQQAAVIRRRAVVSGVGAVALGAVGVAVVARSRARTAGAEPDAAVTGPLPTEHIPPDTEGHRGGSGTPLLLLHGLSVTWRTWRPVLPMLEQHHDVIAPTLLGHSGAAALGEGVEASVEALVDGVVAELDRLGLDKVHVAGNSLGGWISLELARRGRARSVVVFSPGGGWRSNRRMAVMIAGMRASLRAMEALGERAEKLAWTSRGRRLLAWSQFEHPERVDPIELIADIRALRSSSVVRPLLQVLSKGGMQPLPDPGCPVRVVWPRRDRVIPFAHHGQPMVDRIPSAELVWLEGVGHVPMPDDPEAVARLILEVTSSVDRLRTVRSDESIESDAQHDDGRSGHGSG